MTAAPIPLRDWTRVSAGMWHDMHVGWTAELAGSLNRGLLPEPHFALAERTGFPAELPMPDIAVEIAIAAATDPLARPRPPYRITVRHPDGDRVVAIIEFASPGNRDAAVKVIRFARTIAAALEAGVHCLLIDPFPPTTAAPAGLHGAITTELGGDHRPDPDRPLTFAGYCATGVRHEYAAAVEPRAVGEPVPTVPLFLDPDWFLPLDLAPSYAAAFRGCPEPVRERLSAGAEQM